MSDAGGGGLPRARELALLATLAAVQFTHVVDFMIMMPLAPQLMRLWDIGPKAFGLLVSVYTFAAAASGLFAVFVIDRYDRRHALLVVYAGFTVATALCGVAPGYEALLNRNLWISIPSLLCGFAVWLMWGIITVQMANAGFPFAPDQLFSLAAIAGVPVGLWLAAHFSWRTPFLGVAAVSIAVGALAWRVVPPIAGHVEHGRSHGALARLRSVVAVPNHWRAFAFVVALMFAGFTVIPFIAAYSVANVGITEAELPVMYAAGGLATLVTAQVIGHLADRFGKQRVFMCVAIASIPAILTLTHMPRSTLAGFLPVSVAFMVLVTGRFGPAMALVSGSAQSRVRGSFMSLNAAVQQFGAGSAAFVAGAMIGEARDGSLTGFGGVGWLASACSLLAIGLAYRIRVADDPRPGGRSG